MGFFTVLWFLFKIKVNINTTDYEYWALEGDPSELFRRIEEGFIPREREEPMVREKRWRLVQKSLRG